MKLDVVIVFLIVILIVSANGTSVSSLSATRHLRANNPDVEVLNIRECPYMASVQAAPGRVLQGVNAIFIAASWVLTLSYVPKMISGGNEIRLKHIVVVSSTANALQGGRVHKVKDVINVPGDLLALIKVSGEMHRYTNIVDDTFVLGSNEPLTLFRWNNDNKILKTTNINVINACYLGTMFMCIPSVPLVNYLDISAPLLTLDKKLVALVLLPTSGDLPYEIMVNISTYYKKIISIMHKT